MKKKFTALDSIRCFMIALVSFFALQIIVTIITSAIFPDSAQNGSGPSNLFYAIATSFCEISFLTGLLFIRKEKPLKALSMDKKPKLLIALICVLISTITMVCFLSFNDLFLYFLDNIGYNTSTGSSVSTDTIGNLFISLFAYALVPAVCEEILFRGICFNGLKEKGNIFAVLLSAFLFMIIHMGLTQSIYQVILGVIFALVLMITSSLFYSMIMHLINNSIILIVSYIMRNATESVTTYTKATDYILPFVWLIIGGIIVFFLFRLLVYMMKKQNQIDLKEIVSDNNVIVSDPEEKNQQTQLENKINNIVFIKTLIVCLSVTIAIYALMIAVGFNSV